MSLSIHVAISLLFAGGTTMLAACDGGGSWSEEDHEAAMNVLVQQIADIESDLERVNGYVAIHDNELQYTRGLDRHDGGLINESLWPDAEASYGRLVTMDELATWANDSHADYATHQHHVTGLTTDIDGDTAHVESYIMFSSDTPRDKSRDAEGVPSPGRIPSGAKASLGTGRYLNRYERRDGAWKSRVHEYVHEISMRLQAVDLCAKGCLGRWDKTDISYLRPLRPLSEMERQRRAEESRRPRASGD